MSYQYDLFISFKNSTEKGLTEDREVASRFFQELNQDGYKVFFSNTVLSDKGVANYMLEIQNALEGAKAILVVFSQAEYILQGWVAQEWMTFLNLLMKDPNRNIYIFSIKNDTANLPPFLRPYECFGDYQAAISHMSNGMKNQNAVQSNGIGKREFLNAYWGLFGNTDIDDYIGKPMRDPFYNYEVYCLKSRYINGGDSATYIEGLKNVIETKQNPLAMYLLSRYYRDVRYLDLRLSGELACLAYESFMKKVANSSEDNEISLWILTDDKQYDGAFYMCDIIHDVLDSYAVKTQIKIVTPNDLEDLSFSPQRKTVLFWSDAGIEVPETFITALRENKDKVLIGLNSFGDNALPYDIKECELFENSNLDITKICRVLLS